MRPELVAWLEESYPRLRWRGLAGDASTRRFWRILFPEQATRIVMDYGAPFVGETDDVRLSRVFQEAGLRIASIDRVVPDPGCLVLEDLGDRTFEIALAGASATQVEDLYRRAVDCAVAIAERGTRALRRSDRAAGPALDSERFRFEMEFFVEHYVRGLRGIESVDPGLVASLRGLADLASSSPRVLCHRDYHARNLLVLRDGELAMVDIQDARWGPDTYDLASLLRDAYVDLDEELVVELCERYRTSLPDPPEPAAFRSRFAVVAAQRMIKALGTFGYQVHRLGRERYRDAIPRTVRRLARLLPGSPVPKGLIDALGKSGLLEP
jgi:hypothetical protein